MQPDIGQLLMDMKLAVERIERFTRGKVYDDYAGDELLRIRVERQFEIIGEAMMRLLKRDPEIAQRIRF